MGVTLSIFSNHFWISNPPANTFRVVPFCGIVGLRKNLNIVEVTKEMINRGQAVQPYLFHTEQENANGA